MPRNAMYTMWRILVTVLILARLFGDESPPLTFMRILVAAVLIFVLFKVGRCFFADD